MKIGILTQPLLNNYGGLLQNYALQNVLTGLGHEAVTINIVYKDISNIRKLASILKRTLFKISGQNILIRAIPNKKEAEIIGYNTKDFVKRNIVTTKIINKKLNKKQVEEFDFNAYIVGSDQVWRPMFSPQQSTYFLDFLEKDNSVKKIAYAASFGVSNWEFTKKQTKYFSKLIKLFNAVSVREDSAVDLCNKYFNIDAVHLLDPTMLLDKEIYTSLLDKQAINQTTRKLFAYILDQSDEKSQIIKQISRKYDLQPFSIMPQNVFSDPERKTIKDCIIPPVYDWLKSFIDAQFVITDSFHGTVFSILFNKPFLSIANNIRGLTRFISLLKLFELEDRLIFSYEDNIIDNIKEIDWNRVNYILGQEKDKSIKFLNNHLNKDNYR